MEELKSPDNMSIGEKRQWIVDTMFDLAYNAYHEKSNPRVLKDLMAAFTQLLPALNQIVNASDSEKPSTQLIPLSSTPASAPITALEISQQISEIYRLMLADAIPTSQATEKLEMLSLMARILRDLPATNPDQTVPTVSILPQKIQDLLRDRIEAPLRHAHAWQQSVSRALDMKVFEAKHANWLAADVVKLMAHTAAAEKFHNELQKKHFRHEVDNAKEFALEHKPPKKP